MTEMGMHHDPRNVDPVHVAEWLARGQALIAGHADECECPWCMAADLDRITAARGLDPSRYLMEMPSRGGYKSVPWWELPMPAGTRWTGRAPTLGWETPQQPDPGDAAPRILVDYIGPGVWARIAGTDQAGNPLTVSGPVVAGPDEVDGAIVVKVRDYRAGCDRVVWAAPGTLVDLSDETAEPADRAAWATAPVFGDGARLVYLLRRRIGRTGKRRPTDRWYPEVHNNVSAEQLAEWEQGNPDVRLTAVHHEHISALDASR